MQTLPLPKINFIVSLSNGETIIEGKGDYQWLNDGRKSPWQRLIRYTVENKLLITSLSLYSADGRVYTLPPSGKFAKFKGYADRGEKDKPIDYHVERFLARDTHGVMEGGKATMTGSLVAEFYTKAIAYYPGYQLELWVDELDTRNSWVNIRYDN